MKEDNSQITVQFLGNHKGIECSQTKEKEESISQQVFTGYYYFPDSRGWEHNDQ